MRRLQKRYMPNPHLDPDPPEPAEGTAAADPSLQVGSDAVGGTTASGNQQSRPASGRWQFDAAAAAASVQLFVAAVRNCVAANALCTPFQICSAF